MAMNGKVVAEQIGAQIFIDGWAMVSPGDPEQAPPTSPAARRASPTTARPSTAPRCWRRWRLQAFVESDTNKLIDIGVAQIPNDSVLYRMIGDIRDWHAKHGDDWRATFAEIKANYGYDKYGGNCHMVPNHGLIVHGLLHGNDDFQRALMVVNTSGWDTDCNSGNLGCLLGIQHGLEGIDAGPDWRGPFSDICYMPSADSGSGVTDAVTQAARIASIGRRLGGSVFEAPKDGARYHFAYPGSVQGFTGHQCVVNNREAPSGGRCLAIHFDPLASGTTARATTSTFVDSLETARHFEGRGYGLMTSPTLSPGQTVAAKVELAKNVDDAAEVSICIRVFDADDKLMTLRNPPTTLDPGSRAELSWTIPDLGGYPIAAVGVQLVAAPSGGTLYLDSLHWTGAPEVKLAQIPGSMWSRAWVNGVDQYLPKWGESFRLVHNRGTGLLLHGARDWQDYRVSADVTPHLIRRAGIGARVQGMRRYYALVLNAAGSVQIVRELDGTTVLAEAPLDVEFYRTYQLEIAVEGTKITGSVDGEAVLETDDDALATGGIALLIDEGRTATQAVSIAPVRAA